MNYSVIIPTYNRLDVLKRALLSVYAQTIAPTEVIVVDDASTDETVDWLKEHYPQLVLLEHQQNQGVSAARNTAIQYCQEEGQWKTEWLAFLDSDDEWLPEKMQQQSQELEKTGLKVCHTEEIWIRNGVRVNAKKKHQKKRGDIFSDCLQLCAMSPSAIVLHKDIFTEFKGFDEGFTVCEDYDLWLRICAKYPVALVEQAMIKKYGGHEDQLSRRYFGMDKYRIMAMQKLLDSNLPKEKRNELHQVLFKKLGILKQGAEKHQNQELLAFCESRDELFSQLAEIVENDV